MSSSIIYGLYYSKVCGQIRGYQYNSQDGFPLPLHLDFDETVDIDNCNTYVDGVTITYSSNPCKHIWTYVCGLSEGLEIYVSYWCLCNNGNNGTIVPSFVGGDYYCESGLPAGQQWQSVLYSNDTLWDGQQCKGNEGLCCIYPKMPWFVKTLNETTTEDIEQRMCSSEASSNEDTPLDNNYYRTLCSVTTP